MKNKISDLRDHMFAALERLGNEDLSLDELKAEIDRSRAISEVGKVIVESAKTEVLYAKLTRKKEAEPTKFLEVEPEETPQLDRPEAKYSNPQFNN
jgi:hypothetical protein